MSISVVPDDRTLTLSWPTPLPAGAEFVVVKWRPTGSSVWNVSANLYNACTLNGLLNGTSYDLRAVCVPAGGTSTAAGTPAIPKAWTRPVLS